MVIHAYIMTSCQVVGIEGERPVEHYCKANMAVTCQAGVRRATGHVLLVKHVHNRVLKLLLNVYQVKGYIQHACYAPFIINRFQGGAVILYSLAKAVFFYTPGL